VLIGWPLIESRRAVLLEREQRRAAQAGATAAIRFTERLQAGVRTIALLADRHVNIDPIALHERTQLGQFLQAARADTIFDCLAIVDIDRTLLATDGACPHTFDPTDGVVFVHTPGTGLSAQIAAPLLQPSGLVGRLVGTLQIDHVLIDTAKSQQDLELSVIANQTVTAASLPERVGMLAIPQANGGPITLPIGHQTFLAYYTILTDLQGHEVAWTEVLLPLAPIVAAQASATVIIISGTLTAMVLAVALGWFVAHRLSRSVEQLRQAASAIGAGDLTQTVVTVRGAAELRQLRDAIETMRQQLAQTRQDLEAEKQRYADILESIDEAVITLDAETHVTSMNHGGEIMLGCTRDQAINQPLVAIITPDDGRPLRLASIPRRGAIRIAMRTATRQTLMVSASCATAIGRNEQILVLRDVSDDAALRQLKDAFLANITHELRTPLAAQIASLEILREEDDALTPAERRQMLDALHMGVQRLDLLIQNLLDSASIEAGYFRIEPEPCQLEPLIREAATLVEPLLRQRHQQLMVVIEQVLPPILADGRRIIQVLINLLANASKFGPHGDTLQIEAHYHAPDQIQFWVSDHGPGVPESRRERLFERFVRPGTETVQEQGAGLGLAIVKAIIDRHGGSIALLPNRGTGTTVVVRVPIA
jgi:signal transduction histidine kinase